jgi:hypothetical protein
MRHLDDIEFDTASLKAVFAEKPECVDKVLRALQTLHLGGTDVFKDCGTHKTAMLDIARKSRSFGSLTDKQRKYVGGMVADRCARYVRMSMLGLEMDEDETDGADVEVKAAGVRRVDEDLNKEDERWGMF